MVEQPVSYLESTVPIAACEIAVSVRPAGCAYFVSRGGTFLRSPSAFYAISSGLPSLWQGKRIAGDELNARAKANGYQKRARREEGSRRDRNKHGDKHQERSRWSVRSLCALRERFLPPKTMDTDVEFQLAPSEVTAEQGRPSTLGTSAMKGGAVDKGRELGRWLVSDSFPQKLEAQMNLDCMIGYYDAWSRDRLNKRLTRIRILFRIEWRTSFVLCLDLRSWDDEQHRKRRNFELIMWICSGMNIKTVRAATCDHNVRRRVFRALSFC
jgi:hypothetical protein